MQKKNIWWVEWYDEISDKMVRSVSYDSYEKALIRKINLQKTRGIIASIKLK